MFAVSVFCSCFLFMFSVVPLCFSRCSLLYLCMMFIKENPKIFYFFYLLLLDNDLCFWGRECTKIVPSKASFVMISFCFFFCVFLQFLLADKSLGNLIIYGQRFCLCDIVVVRFISKHFSN